MLVEKKESKEKTWSDGEIGPVETQRLGEESRIYNLGDDRRRAAEGRRAVTIKRKGYQDGISKVLGTVARRGPSPRALHARSEKESEVERNTSYYLKDNWDLDPSRSKEKK